ncbi:hypothetical protein B0T24DRAFT_628963 [Lasiosphaeria ovina]|uniref:Secreted protein n=1 Tax=Lasiosphaeria ovina TaxID=92902 RepID=A0AAE0N5W3_9PEZI|nr:hypothetical protein B0T24DRAFT_628963 [Lasiosphaeria ovina]
MLRTGWLPTYLPNLTLLVVLSTPPVKQQPTRYPPRGITAVEYATGKEHLFREPWTPDEDIKGVCVWCRRASITVSNPT